MRPPISFVSGVILLWAAWLVSATDLVVNHIVFHGSQVGPGLPIGVASLIVHAAALILVGRGRGGARYVLVVFALLSASPLAILSRLVAERSFWTASYIASAFLLKAAGVVLLFTADSRRWFAERLN